MHNSFAISRVASSVAIVLAVATDWHHVRATVLWQLPSVVVEQLGRDRVMRSDVAQLQPPRPAVDALTGDAPPGTGGTPSVRCVSVWCRCWVGVGHKRVFGVADQYTADSGHFGWQLCCLLDCWPAVPPFQSEHSNSACVTVHSLQTTTAYQVHAIVKTEKWQRTVPYTLPCYDRILWLW